MKWRNDHLEYDWFHRPLPRNIDLGENVYIESNDCFAAFFSTAAHALVMGEASGAYGPAVIATGPDARIEIGAYTCLNSCTLIADAEIRIGAHCLFAWGTYVTDACVPGGDLAARRAAMRETAADPLRRLRPAGGARPVRIGDNVWVGFNSAVLGGVAIGRGAIIGCNTVVSKDVPDYAVVVGNPPRIVKRLEPTDTEEARLGALREFGLAPAMSPA
jgi:acetyltransferase-like isoleucine patch superfamily enzyme